VRRDTIILQRNNKEIVLEKSKKESKKNSLKRRV